MFLTAEDAMTWLAENNATLSFSDLEDDERTFQDGTKIVQGKVAHIEAGLFRSKVYINWNKHSPEERQDVVLAAVAWAADQIDTQREVARQALAPLGG